MGYVPALTQSSVVIGSTTLDIEHLVVNKELTGKLPTCSLTKVKEDADDNTDVGNTINVWLNREGGTWKHVFTGDLVEKGTREEGKAIHIDYEGIQVPDMNIRTVTKVKGNINLGSLCEDIIAPLVDDNIISSTIAATIYTGTVYYEGSNKVPILNELTEICKNNTLDFYLDVGDTIHIYRTVDAPNSTLSLDQTLSTAIMITDSEYIRSVDRVRNTIDVFGNWSIIEKDDDTDYFTEDTVGTGFTWSTYWYNGSSWDTADTETSIVTKLSEGDYSIRHKVDRSNLFGEVDVYALRARVTLNPSIDPREYAYLKFDIQQNLEYTNFSDFMFSEAFSWAGFKLMTVKLFDTSGNSIWVDIEGERKHIEIPVGSDVDIDYAFTGGDEYQTRLMRKGWVSIDSTFDWTNISTIDIIEYTKYKNILGDNHGSRCGIVDVKIDKLHFDGIRAEASYGSSASMGSFGTRPYTDPIDTRGLDTDAACLKRAQDIINRLKDPEVSLRGVECFGHKDLNIGDKIYTKTNIVDSTFTITGLNHVIHGFDWKSNVMLSSSEVYESSRTKEIIDVDRDLRIRDLNDRIEMLEMKIDTGQLGPAFHSTIPIPATIEFNNMPFDWTSILAGATAWSTSQMTQWMTSWTSFATAVGPAAITTAGSVATGAINLLSQIINGLFTADADGRGKFAELFVDEAHIASLAVTTAKIGSLAVTTAKIDSLAVTNAKIGLLAVDTAQIADAAIEEAKIANLAVTTGKIDTLAVDTAQIADAAVETAKIANLAVDTAQIASAAVTTAKIDSLAVTNIKIANNVINWEKVDGDFAWQAWSGDKVIVTSFEAITGFDITGVTGAGSWATRKNQQRLYIPTGSTGEVWMEGYPIMSADFNPKFKGRIKINPSTFTVDWQVGLGDCVSTGGYGYCTDFTFFSLWNVDWTVNDTTNGRWGLKDDTTGESILSRLATTINNSIGVAIYRLDTDPHLHSEITPQYHTLPTTKGTVKWTYNNTSTITIDAGDALVARIRLYSDGTATVKDFVTNTLQPCTILPCNWTFHLICQNNTVESSLHFYYGSTDVGGLVYYPYVSIDAPMMYGIISEETGKRHLYPLKIWEANTDYIIEGRYDSGTATWELDGIEVVTDDYMSLPTDIQESAFYIGATAQGCTLEITYYQAEEDWS